MQEMSMSLINAPSKAEVMGWNPQSLANYMRRFKLSGCDTVVMKGGITGAQFLHMTECNLQVFPCLYVPIITKIQSDINKAEQRKAFDHNAKAQRYPQQVFVQEEDVCDSDEFEDNGSDPDYEALDEEAAEDDYICALAESQTAKQLYSQKTCKGNYRLPAAPRPMRPPQPPTVAPLQDCHREGSAVKAPSSRAPKLTNVFNRASELIPPPPVPTQPAECIQGLDPNWYGGMVTRRQAEEALREVNKDGAFVVRDSSKGSAEHPYTLMLLYQGKVYNIKIRNQGNSCSLGNGLNNTKSFPGVKEMITHHTHTPLLLIDATDHSSKEQPQCCLLHPAGL